MEEVFKAIEGYEGLYEVSNLGRVRSLDSYDRLGRLHKKGKILKPAIIKDGYLQVHLSKEGKKKTFMVHRLVAQAFIPNPEGLPIINHKDENPKNNRVENIEWCDYKYNSIYGTCKERMIQTKISNGLVDPELCGLTEKERNRLYKRKNRDKINELNRKYRQKNKERLNKYQREYRLKKKQEKKKNNRPSEESLW